MKKFPGIFVVLILAMSGCDKVTDPIQHSGSVETKRKVLLEDYTGHTCGNCPAAAEVAENIYDDYNGKVVVIAVHAGSFAKVKKPKYPASYSTVEGEIWDDFYIGNSGNPNGLINRKNYQNNGLVQYYSKWPSSVAVALNDIHYVDIGIKADFNASARKLNISVTAVFARRYANNTRISVVLTEDSIIGPQTDYRNKLDERTPDYVFMHMLREVINGTWGTPLKQAPISYQDSVTVSFNDFPVKDNYKTGNMAVIAFVFDEVTREVLQVEKIKFP